MAQRRKAARGYKTRGGRKRRVNSRRGRTRTKITSRRGRRPISTQSSEFNVPLCVPKNVQDIRFNTYIKKVLKKVKPRLNINRQSVRIMDTLMKDTLHQIAAQASNKMGRRKTLKPKILMRAMKKVMPRSLVLKADERGQKALDRYQSHAKKRRRGRPMHHRFY